MCSSCAEILDQRIIGINSTQSICRQGDRIIVIDGICKGEKPLGELLLEIAADRINAITFFTMISSKFFNFIDKRINSRFTNDVIIIIFSWAKFVKRFYN